MTQKHLTEGENEILAIIPARSGSKSLPDKNIRPFRGKPLLVHSIETALSTKLVNRVIVSTDSPDYAEIARKAGAEVPFLRPTQLAGDFSTDLEVFQHLLNWLGHQEAYRPDICLHLRPTYPQRRLGDVESVLKLLIENPSLDSVRSVSPSKAIPFKMWFRDEYGLLSPVCTLEGVAEAYNAPRQILPCAFEQNASIDAVRTTTILEGSSMTGQRIHGYVMNENFDIDSLEDFMAAEDSCS